LSSVALPPVVVTLSSSTPDFNRVIIHFGDNTMVHGDTRARSGLSTFLLASSALIWISAVIVMGILAYLVSEGMGGDHVIYGLVIVSYPWRISSLMWPVTYR
jgi:hypothetical protein